MSLPFRRTHKQRRVSYSYQDYSAGNRPPANKKKIYKLLIVGLALSLFFMQGSNTVGPALASNQTVLPPKEQLASLDTYLSKQTDAPLPRVYAKSYILVDASNGDVLIEKDMRVKVPVASTTKMVTALVAKELFDLNDIVTVDRLASRINGSEIKLVYGEKITIRDLIKGLLIQSGNDAAFAIAEHYSKEPRNYELFVEQMNDYVVGMGLKDTVFGDPAGLDDETGRSTAWDLAQIARKLLHDPLLSEIVATSKTAVASVDGRYTHILENSNRLINPDSSYYLPGAIGIKTGFTPDAGHCLVSAYKLGDSTIIGVVLSTNEFSITASASESRKLYSWANRYIKKSSY